MPIPSSHKTHYYFIGIGGIGMSALARYLHASGKLVMGYDKTPSPVTNQLEQLGITLSYEDDFDSIPQVYKNEVSSQVIYTPAIPDTMGELVRFRESGITPIKRAQLLAQITRDTHCYAVAGTHGKTTTSAILAHILKVADEPMTGFIGGILDGYQSNLIQNGTRDSVVEADEFDRSFMQLFPDQIGITSMDADHLDIYGDTATIEQSFHDFAEKVTVENRFIQLGLPVAGNTVGIGEKADYAALNVSIEDGAYCFDYKTPHQIYTGFRFSLPGRHNLNNAMMALAMATSNGVSVEKLREGLASFTGVDRRFSIRMRNNNVVLIDDYAHHPTELQALYDALREMYPDEKINLVFQPHLYSRTNDFMDDFARVISQFDQVSILDIYPARELPMDGVTTAALIDRIAALTGKKARLIEIQNIAEVFKASDTRICVMAGAGDIGVHVQSVKEQLS